MRITAPARACAALAAVVLLTPAAPALAKARPARHHKAAVHTHLVAQAAQTHC